MNINIIASGDSFITRRIPTEGYEGFEELKEVISNYDVRFSNLEMTFHNMEGTPAASSGGTWAMAAPECLDDMTSYGFNLFTTANNHSGDYGEGGITATIRHLRERGMLFSGTGHHLDEACAACYLETRKARVGLISASATFPPASMAGGQSGQVNGRPGVNPLRFTTTYHVTQEYYDTVKRLAEVTYINAYDELGIKLGYVPSRPEGTMRLGSYTFVLDDQNYVDSKPLERDMLRIEAEIREADRQSDLVLVSLHAHETDQDNISRPPKYLETAAKRCIDAGAHAVIGHGPHEMRGIEIYNGGLILYSLGNFIFETETVSVQPYDSFYNKGLPTDMKVGAYMDKRSNHGTTGYPAQENIWRSVLAGFSIHDGRLSSVQLYPISLGMGAPRTKRGIPVLSWDDRTLKYLDTLCRPYGTKIRIENHIGYIDI